MWEGCSGNVSLPNEGTKHMSIDQAELAGLSPAVQAYIASLQAKADKPPRTLTLKVSEKGCVSLYGMGKFPVSLYGSQWERLLNEADAIRAFLVANAALLSVKGNK